MEGMDGLENPAHVTSRGGASRVRIPNSKIIILNSTGRVRNSKLDLAPCWNVNRHVVLETTQFIVAMTRLFQKAS